MVRRSRNEGSVFQMQAGRWVAVLELPSGANGKRNRRRRMGQFPGAAQLGAVWLAVVQVAALAGTGDGPGRWQPLALSAFELGEGLAAALPLPWP